MTPIDQVLHAVVLAPLAFFRLRPKTLLRLSAYLVLAGLIFALLAGFRAAHQQDIKAALLGYLFPESWRAAAELLLSRFLARQSEAVLVNAVAGGALVVISLLLFWLKELVSFSFERENQISDGDLREFPLWFQAAEELKLVLLYLTFQMGIFALGYHPHPVLRALSTALSFGFLYFSYAIDFVSPLLQRHALCYSQILKVLARHPLASLGFGAIMSAPAVLAGHHVERHLELPFDQKLTLLCAGNLVSVVLSCVGGTYLAAKLLPMAQGTRPTRPVLRGLAWLLLLGAFGAGLYGYGSLLRSLHHKSQILKCHYRLVPGTLAFARPRFASLLGGQVDVGLSATLAVENPTPYDLELEQNRIELYHGETRVAQGRLAPVRVPSHATREQPVGLQLSIDAKALLKGRELFQDKWRLTLYLEVMPGFEFPIYVKHQFASSLLQHFTGR